MRYVVYISSLVSVGLNRTEAYVGIMAGKDRHGNGEEPVGFVATIRGGSSASLEITVPKAVVDMLSLKQGDNCQFTIKRGG